MDLKVSKMGAAFSFKFLLMSKITERETRMIIKPSANLRGLSMMFQYIKKQITLSLYKPDSRSDVQ